MPVLDDAVEELQLGDHLDTEQSEVEEEIGEFKPGELCPIDATNNRIDLDEDDGSGLTREEKENCLKGLAAEAAKRDLTSRRLEVRDAWKARYFDRGNQYLLPGPKGTWVLPQQVLGGQSFDEHSTETNIYLAFRDTITAALTAGLPSVRFEASNPNNPADLSGADNAEKARKLIERDNDMVPIQGEIGRYLWTDGRAMIYVRHVVDSQRFGFINPDLPEIADELAYLPEEGGEGPMTDLGFNKEPRGQEVIEAFGALETKVPIQSRNIHETDYVQLSREFDITRLKAKYPKKADQIQAMAAPTAESDYERLARTSIMMGMRPSNMTNDAMTYNATEQLTWVRPSFFFAEKDERKRNWLWDTFGDQGAMIAICGQTLCEARVECLDDHWTMVHARPGDGMHRPAIGSPIIPIQEKLNDCMDLVHESFMHLIPRIWVDPSIDLEAVTGTQRRPGQYVKAPKARTEKDIGANFFPEPQIQIAEGLLVYIEKLFGEFAQFLCGAFPALFGGNTGSNDTASGIAQQRDQALGRIGLTWRNMKAAYARIMRQAVQAAAEHRKERMTGEIKGASGSKMQLSLDPNDLKGNVRCFPDTDENFPESWVAQRAVWTNLLTMAGSNPVFAKVLATAQNLRLAKDKVGTPELVIPGAQANEKQLGEIMLLLNGAPIPNPAVDEAKAKLAAIIQQHVQAGPQPNAAGTGTDPQLEAEGNMLQAQIQTLPPQVSSVPIGKLDDHAAEMDTIETWANSPEGIKAKAEHPDGFANVELHYDEHAAALAAKNAGNAPQPEKPVSVSLAGKDLPPEGLVQLAAKVGIKLDLNQLKQEQAKEDAKQAAELEAKKRQPAQPGSAETQGA